METPFEAIVGPIVAQNIACTTWKRHGKLRVAARLSLDDIRALPIEQPEKPGRPSEFFVREHDGGKTNAIRKAWWSLEAMLATLP